MTDTKTSGDAHGKLRDGIDSVRGKAAEAADASREKARDAARQTVETIEANPIGVIVGGLALGALIGAVIPRSTREKELLAPVGKRVGATAVAALAAAKDAGKSELAELGLSRSAAKDQVKSLFDGIIKAVSSAGNAAAQAGKDEIKAR